jgi:hypothetical protein
MVLLRAHWNNIPIMNPALLGLIGALDAFAHLIESERESFSKSFALDDALRTLERAKDELRDQALASARVETAAREAFESARQVLISHLPQGSPLEALMRGFPVSIKSLTITYDTSSTEVPTPSLSGSKSSIPSPFDETHKRLAELAESVRLLIER